MTDRTTIQSRVLFRLVQANGAAVPYTDLAWAAWPKARPDQWLNSLRVAVAALRCDGYGIHNIPRLGYRLARYARQGGIRIHMVA